MQKLVIEKDILKKIFDIIFDKIEGYMPGSISIPQDYYLNIPMDEAYAISKNIENIKPAIGSLYDDWENLTNLIDKKHPVTFVDVDRLASIMKAISQELNPPLIDVKDQLT